MLHVNVSEGSKIHANPVSGPHRHSHVSIKIYINMIYNRVPQLDSLPPFTTISSSNSGCLQLTNDPLLFLEDDVTRFL